MAVTIVDVGRHANVCHKTVSNVLNNSPFVSRKVRERVLESIKELNYIPNETARRLRTNKAPGKTYNIGCLIFIDTYNKFADPFFSKILEGIDRETMKQKYHLFFTYTINDLKNNLDLSGRITPENVDGLICMSGMSPEEQQIFDNVSGRIKHIAAIVSAGAKNADNFDVDREQAGYAAVEYLIKSGHRRIGFVGSHTDPNEGRFFGYLRALKEHGIEYDESIVEGEFWKFGIQHGYRYMKKILETAKPLPTAVFASSDLNALGAINAVKDKGLKVPGDISVIGFDDIDDAQNFTPALTTMRVKKEELGSMAVRRLIEHINNPELSPVRTIVPAELVVRDSCASPKAQTSDTRHQTSD